jgi:hypothetical protein
LVNDRWEKNPLSSEELKKIQPLLDTIRVLKQQGLNGFKIVASYLRRRVQPLKAREHYGFEYSGAEDPSRMVSAMELTEEEVMECLKKILKGVSVVPHTVPEYRADNLPPAVSCFSSVSTLFFIFPLLLVLSVFISLTSLLLLVVYLQDLSRNFVDPILVDDIPSGVKARENLARASSTSKSQATTILPGAS